MEHYSESVDKYDGLKALIDFYFETKSKRYLQRKMGLFLFTVVLPYILSFWVECRVAVLGIVLLSCLV